ncbi:Nicotinamide riboside transporter PnuC [Methanimicrococcus sp. At1]|uniref:Nicotinamide riboside transporter PnuC n=1 Tax=Methanimicrococcus hacksteinii TaxID=3028293 RepID=A0ABU3VSM4_9EURY|nr:nicotinamide riboside transporter PnuC [Methanimicrococcus sp. At1]MDV0445915.1 Nicotinamide riboside transporter PnuC [Methanimicrococcus sp. At1]
MAKFKLNYIFRNWSVFEITWLIVFFIIGIILSVVWESDLISTIAFITGIFCVVLVAKGSIWNYAFGLINCIAYAYVAFCSLLYGEVILNLLYYLPMQFIGIYLWTRNSTNDKRVRMKELTRSKQIGLFIITIICIVLFQQLLIMLGSTYTGLDSITTVVSVVAQILLALRYKEQWLLWIIVNIISIIMWTLAGNPIMVLMWTAYLINAAYGYYNWNKGAKLNV